VSRSGFGFLLLSRLFPSAGISEQNGAHAVIPMIEVIAFFASIPSGRAIFWQLTHLPSQNEFFIGIIKLCFFVSFFISSNQRIVFFALQKFLIFNIVICSKKALSLLK